jgi:hypothetical protein
VGHFGVGIRLYFHLLVVLGFYLLVAGLLALPQLLVSAKGSMIVLEGGGDEEDEVGKNIVYSMIVLEGGGDEEDGVGNTIRSIGKHDSRG